MASAARTTWVLVADGARANVYVNAGRGTGLEPVFDYEFAAPTRNPDRRAESDRPGRSFDRFGEGRHAMEPAEDWQHHAKRQFAKSLAEELERNALQKAFDDLVVVAPPEFLGLLRDVLGKNVERHLKAEVGKDLTHIGHKHLPEHLSDVVPM